MRAICLALPEATEKIAWGELTWRVKGKLFATCGDKHGACEIIVGLEPARAAALGPPTPAADNGSPKTN